MLPKTWQGPILRDLLASSIRRAPTPHSSNSDSLRRVVLQRNVLAAATGDNEAHSPSHASFRHLASEKSLAALFEEFNTPGRSHADSLDKLVLDTSRSIQSKKSLKPVAQVKHDAKASDELREDAWFDHVMEELDWSSEAADIEGDATEAPSTGRRPANSPKWSPLDGPPPVHGNRLYTLPTIPE